MDRAKEFLKCLGNGSGSEEQAYKDDTPEERCICQVCGCQIDDGANFCHKHLFALNKKSEKEIKK